MKGLKIALIALATIIALGFIGSLVFEVPTEAEINSIQQSDANEASRQDVIKSQFTLNGTHKGVRDYLMDRMNNPSSFDHVKSTYSDEGDYLLVTTKYRGTNAYGGLVLEQITAKVTYPKGDVFEVVSTD